MRIAILIMLTLSVLKAETTLQWQMNDIDLTYPVQWEEAIAYCEDLSLNGYDDWRLPNINELSSIIDLSKSSPAVQDAFKDIYSLDYWSSTSLKYNRGFGWFVDFESGDVNSSPKYIKKYVRCIRDAQ